MARMGLRRAGAGLVLVLLGGGIWAASNWDSVQARYAVHRMKSAATEEERAQWADALAQGEAGAHRLVQMTAAGEPALRTSAAGALDRRLNTLAESDPRASAIAAQLLELFSTGDEPAREAIVPLLPTLLSRAGAVHMAKCKSMVTAALKMPSVPARLAAIRAAMNPQIGLRTEIVSLLEAVEPEVRRAALFAVGPATDAEAVIGDEALFHWLHDPDAGVRTICREALASRGRTESEIALGGRLVHPDASERLNLLLDLRYDDDVPDPEPWLERLSRDVDPGVRAGSVRVMMELCAEKRQVPPAWPARIAERDSDLTVRRIASFYLSDSVKLIQGP